MYAGLRPARPSPRTVQQWPGAMKIRGEWYIDLDEWRSALVSDAVMEELLKDPDVATCVGYADSVALNADPLIRAGRPLKRDHD